MILYFGTYTRRNSNGIYAADFNTQTGELTNCRLIVEEPNPTYLSFSSDHFLYSVGTENGQGGLVAISPIFDIVNHAVEDGAPHCYVAVDDERQLVYGANYHKGQVLVYKRLENGRLELRDCKQHEGSGPHDNQTSSHVHFADKTPDSYLVTCDLGTDEVITYTVAEDGQLAFLARYHATPGAGPRHIIFHPTAKIAYLVCELNSTIEVLIYDGLGEFELMQTISTLPSDYQEFNATAAIRLSPDGKFLYCSNRGHNSIAVYEVKRDASLELIEIVPSLGETPRDFILSPDGRFLIVAHQDSDNVCVFERDHITGKLRKVSSDFLVPEAVCVTYKVTE